MMSEMMGNKDNMSLNWNFEGEHSSVNKPGSNERSSFVPPKKKNKVTSLKAHHMNNMIQAVKQGTNMMSNIPELANESRFSDNYSKGIFLFLIFY